MPGVDAAQQQAVLLTWAEQIAWLLELGLSRKLEGTTLDWPNRSVLLHELPVLERRLLDIEGLRGAGTLNAGEATTQEQAALGESPMSAESLDPPRTLYNRFSSPLINLATAYGVTQNGPLALLIAASEQAAREVLGRINTARWHAIARNVLPEVSPLPPLPHLGTPVDALP